MIEAHRSPEAMARCLISYIDDDERVKAAVYESFGTSLSIHNIRGMRAVKAKSDDLASRDHWIKFNDRGWDWRGSKRREDMAAASHAFVEAIGRERRV